MGDLAPQLTQPRYVVDTSMIGNVPNFAINFEQLDLEQMTMDDSDDVDVQYSHPLSRYQLARDIIHVDIKKSTRFGEV